MNEHPDANAGAAFLVIIAAGKFQGVMAACSQLIDSFQNVTEHR